MALEHVTDHYEREYARLLEQFKDVEDFKKYFQMTAPQWQFIEDVAWEIYTHKFLNAFGATLDQVGKLLAEPRLGDVDDAYKVRLRAKILVLRSSGTLPQIIKIFNQLLPDNVVKIEVFGGASFKINIGQIDIALLPVYIRFLRLAIVAGVGAQLQYNASPVASTFRYDVGPGYDISQYADAVE